LIVDHVPLLHPQGQDFTTALSDLHTTMLLLMKLAAGSGKT
jgi:hypothetical protein